MRRLSEAGAGRGKVPTSSVVSRSADPIETGKRLAVDAGLRYVRDHHPGIVRRRQGSGFLYIGPDGRRVSDAGTLARIRSLVIPPAWRDVWICPQPDGHLQATGRDKKRRKQYRYHPRWRDVRDGNKYERMVEFGRALPLIRRRVEKDLARPGMPA
jgi:DNA topoisomerase-1